MTKQAGQKNSGISVIELLIIVILGFIVLGLVGYMVYYFAGSNPNALSSVDPASEKASWGTVDIREYIKNPSKYDGQQLHYVGKVLSISVVDGVSEMVVNIAIPGASEFDLNLDFIMVRLEGEAPNIYQDSIIEFWGYGDEAEEYTTMLGGNWTQAYIKAKYLNLVTQ